MRLEWGGSQDPKQKGWLSSDDNRSTSHWNFRSPLPEPALPAEEWQKLIDKAQQDGSADMVVDAVSYACPLNDDGGSRGERYDTADGTVISWQSSVPLEDIDVPRLLDVLRGVPEDY